MKRIISILTLIALLLCGCAATSSVKEPKALSELGEGNRAESVAIVTLTINPEFELYLDINMCVSKIRCLNEDAVTALEAVQTNLIGNNYGSAMFSILDAAAQTGFLVPEAQIKIETTLHTPMAEQDLEYMAQSMANPVEAYNENNGLNLSVEAVTPTVDEKAVEAFMKYFETNQPTADQSFVVNGNEASGNLYDENGTKIGTFLEVYDVYGPEGHLLKLECFYDDGTYSCDTFEYDANGNKTKWESSTSDGWSMVETYFTNGNIKSSTTTMQDGSISTDTYYENGNMHMSVYDGPNGEHTESYFAEDGTYAWNRGPANGTLTQTVYGNTVGTTTQYFDENGYLYKAVSEFADGSKDEITFYPNGNQRSALCLSPYGSSYMYYNEDGTLAENRGEPNSVIELGTNTKYFDENGLLYKTVDQYDNGSITETLYYENGNRKSMITDDEDGYYEWHWYINGADQKYIADTSDHYSENTYYPNGITSIAIYRDKISGSYTELHFDEAGNTTYNYYVDENGNEHYVDD